MKFAFYYPAGSASFIRALLVRFPSVSVLRVREVAGGLFFCTVHCPSLAAFDRFASSVAFFVA